MCDVGYFDEWKEQKNSDYILTTVYLEQLARQHDSSIKATAEYLLHNAFSATLYFKEPNGSFKKDKTLYEEEYNYDEAPYEFLSHIIHNISEYKYTSFKTDASHLALRYADRYFYKDNLPTVSTPEIEAVLNEHQVKRDDDLFDQLEQAKAKIDILMEEQSTGSFSMGNPTVAHGEPKTNEQLIQQLNAAQGKINELEAQLSQLRKEKADIHIINRKEGQGDSLLILGAVMHCIKDAAKNNYTQELLTQTILTKYKSISGISESTLKKKYSEAKNYIKQRHTP